MADFEKAYEFTRKWEGGYVNHPSDPGRATNFGITEAVARANGYSGPMKEMPISFAHSVYKKKYWTVCGCDEMEQDKATAVFDTAVNCGVSRAKAWLTATNSTEEFLVRRLRHYENLIAFKESFSVFRKGWFNRLDALALLTLRKNGFTKEYAKA